METVSTYDFHRYIIYIYIYILCQKLLYCCCNRSCLAYVVLVPLKKDLAEFIETWNSHLIRKNRLSECPNGVPNELYEFPSLYG